MYWTVHLYGGPRRVNHAAIAIGTTIFTFGGYCSGVDYKTFKPIDIHILDTVKFKWWVLNNNDQDSTCIPFQRYGHTAVTLGSKVYLWGGRNDKEVCNTLYCFDTETLKWSTPNVYGTIPMPRDGHSACVIKNQMFIFGGFQENPTQFSQDLYMLDFHTMAWSIVKTNGDPPSHRDFHTATAIGNKMYIFGGRGDNDESRVSGKEVYCPNIYYFDTLTKMWVCPVVYGDKPNGRRSHSAFVHNGFMYIFGGFNRNLDLHYKDIHRYDPIKSTWLKMNPKGTSPCARRRQICLVVNDQVFISGGTSPNYPKTQLQNFRVLNYDFSSHILNQLKDHDDLHVLNLNPSLKDMLLVNVWELLDSQGISPLHLCIPTSLKRLIPSDDDDDGLQKSSSHFDGFWCHLLLSLFGVVLLFTGIVMAELWPWIYKNMMRNELELKNDSRTYTYWQRLPEPLTMSVYLFNWTNAEETLRNGQKPILQQLGPYVFKEYHTKVNTTFNHNNTITYKQFKSWKYDRIISNGSLSDEVTTINVVLNILGEKLLAIDKTWLSVIAGYYLKLSNIKPYVTKTAGDFIFEGYDDPLLNVAIQLKRFFPLDLPFKKVGWFYGMNMSTSADGLINMFTGKGDIDRLGLLHSVNYKSNLNNFNEDCSHSNAASAGDLWPEHTASEPNASIYVPTLCRYTKHSELKPNLDYNPNLVNKKT